MSGGWSNSSPEPVILIDAEGDTVASYTYSIGNRPGHSDEKIRIDGGDDPQNWADSAVEGGTPGKPNSVNFSDEAGSGELRVTPNPFGDHTFISYNIPGASAVRIRIYDIRGRKVRNLLTDSPSSGLALWNGRDDRDSTLPRGIYIIHLEATITGKPETRTLRKTVAFAGKW